MGTELPRHASEHFDPESPPGQALIIEPQAVWQQNFTITDPEFERIIAVIAEDHNTLHVYALHKHFISLITHKYIETNPTGEHIQRLYHLVSESNLTDPPPANTLQSQTQQNIASGRFLPQFTRQARVSTLPTQEVPRRTPRPTSRASSSSRASTPRTLSHSPAPSQEL
mgnify:FL=1